MKLMTVDIAGRLVMAYLAPTYLGGRKQSCRFIHRSPLRHSKNFHRKFSWWQRTVINAVRGTATPRTMATLEVTSRLVHLLRHLAPDGGLIVNMTRLIPTGGWLMKSSSLSRHNGMSLPRSLSVFPTPSTPAQGGIKCSFLPSSLPISLLLTYLSLCGQWIILTFHYPFLLSLSLSLSLSVSPPHLSLSSFLCSKYNNLLWRKPSPFPYLPPNSLPLFFLFSK